MCGKVVVRLDRAQSEADSNSKNCARACRITLQRDSKYNAIFPCNKRKIVKRKSRAREGRKMFGVGRGRGEGGEGRGIVKWRRTSQYIG